MHEIRPMYAMKQDYHLKKSLDHGFAEVSDKIRTGLIATGMSERDAAIRAPLQLEGIVAAFTGEIDFKAIHLALDSESKAEIATTTFRDFVTA